LFFVFIFCLATLFHANAMLNSMELLPGIHRWIGFYTMMFFAVAKQLRDGLVVAEHTFSTAKEPQQSPRLEVPQQKDGGTIRC
jgi:hypothetical protein